MRPFADTIAAIATAPGDAGLAVVRVSGPAALACAAVVFRGRASLAEAATHTLHHGWACWPESDRHEPAEARRPPREDVEPAGATKARAARRLDEVVAAVFRAPHSYTREDVVELSCHGGRIAADRVLAALLRAGARLARPGEFTLRAFLHGRLDLAQAEAVADLIHAETRAAHDLALAQLAGGLSRRVDALAERVADALAEVEARVDFAEDVGGIEVPATVRAAIAAVAGELGELLDGAAYAGAIREGVRIPLAGRPNAGKSSLFNALLGEDRAIVTPIPGTTRDLVSERIEIAGVAVTLVDAAGLRESADAVERLGVGRAREAMDASPIVLWVVDGAAPLDPADRAIAARLAGKRVLVALTKSDLPAALTRDEIAALLSDGAMEAFDRDAVEAKAPDRDAVEVEALDRGAVDPSAADVATGGLAVRDTEAGAIVEVSALRGDGLAELRDALAALLGVRGDSAASESAVSNPRHVDALTRAREALDRAGVAAARGAPGEITALELRESLAALGEVTGRNVGDDLLDRIFRRFCVGK